MNAAIDQYYQTYSAAPIKNKRGLRKQELYNLYRTPKKDVGSQQAHFVGGIPGEILQADLLYLPADSQTKDKYALVVVDPASGITDAQPLSQHSSEAVLAGFKEIFDRGTLKLPKTMLQTDDGTEFHGAVEKYFKDKKIGVRYAKPKRSRQTAFAEQRNAVLGKAIHQRQAAEQLLTNEVSRDWVKDLPIFIDAINAYVRSKPEKKKDEVVDPVLTKENNILLPIGTIVRPALDKPIETTGKPLSGGFRKGDIRYAFDKYKITNVIIAPGEPPLYQLDGKENLGTAYTYNQLQVVPKDEQEPPRSVIRGEQQQFTIKKILDKKKEGNKIFYKIWWRGHPEAEAEWRAKSTLKGNKVLTDAYDAAHPPH